MSSLPPEPWRARRPPGRRARLLPSLVVAAGAASAGGCVAPGDPGEYERPPVELPADWRVDLAASSEAVNLTWWKQFEDPVLDELVATALTRNTDLRALAAVVDELAGRAGIARSERFPELGYRLGVSENRRSAEDDFGFAAEIDRHFTLYEALGDVQWEIDLWGRVARANEAALAELAAAEEARDALALSLVSAVAGGYLDLLALDRQLAIARETLQVREDLLDQFEIKAEGGQISGLELAQVRHSYHEVAATIPELERRIALAENALSVLVGRNPAPVPRGKALDALGALDVPAGIPSDLLARRPDLREAEQRLVAAHARMREVHTHYFPRISLTGFAGVASTEVSEWLEDSAGLYSIGADLVGPLFTAGRLKGENRAARAQREQLLQRYLGAVRTALREVEDALVSVAKQRELLEAERLHLATLQEYSSLARQQYDAGLSSYLQVLDADRNLYQRRLEEATTMRDLARSLVASYEAMGGGWGAEPAAAPEE